MLIAQTRNDIAGIITVAGNLDPDGWAQYHNYESLNESENPSLLPPLDATIFRWHFVGENDKNIPLTLSSKAMRDDPSAELFITENGHNCCWIEQWPLVLKRLERRELDNQQ